jgi:ABC-type transporter MlaC component
MGSVTQMAAVKGDKPSKQDRQAVVQFSVNQNSWMNVCCEWKCLKDNGSGMALEVSFRCFA